MKFKLFLTIVSVCSTATSSLILAGDDISAKESIAMPAPAPECSTRELTPLFSRYAQTAKSITLRAGYRDFTDMELQEADEVDGSITDLEVTIPFNDRWQLRLYYPFDTDAEGKAIGQNADLDIEGNGGLLDFPSLIVDYQFKQAASAGEYNMAGYLGVGNVRQHLEATNKKTGSIDRYNHRGSCAILGFKADKQLSNCWSFVGNFGVRYFWDSDDIHPNEGSDTFALVEASTAWIYNPVDAWVYPAIEVLYQGTITDYNSVQVVPQVILPLGAHLDINVGVSTSITDDGPDTEARVQMNLRF